MTVLLRATRAFAAVIAVPTLLSAQQGPPRPDERSNTAPVAQSAPSVVFERQLTRVRLEQDGTGTREMTMHIRANDDAGVRQAGQIPLFYAPSSDDLAVAKLEVHKSDGRVIQVGPEAVQDHAIQPNAAIPMFVDLRQKMVTVPALQPGDMVVITATWKVARPIAGQYSWYEHSFIKHAVVLDERLEIDVPESAKPRVRVAPGAPAEQHGGTGRLDGGRRVFVWHTSNPAVRSGDEDDEGEDAAPADIRITTFDDWNAFTRWLQPLMHPPADASVREKALALTKGISDPQRRIETLYRFVATEIRYVSLSFGLNRYAPHSPADVLRNRYGDCKDKHALLAAMLEVIGVKAVPVLLNTTRSIAEDVPSPMEFDHVITAIPSGDEPSQWQWFDTTLEVAPAGLLSPATRGRLALSLGDNRGTHRLVTIPEDGPFRFVNTIDVDGTINAFGVLVATVRMSLRGDDEVVLRGTLRAIPRESLDEFGKGFAKAIGFDSEISAFSFSDPLSTEHPFEVRFTYRKSGALDWAASEARVEAFTGTLDFDALDPEKTPLKADRRLRSVSTLRRTLKLRLPPAYAATAPVGVRAAKDAFVYASRYEVVGNELRAERTIEGMPRTLLVAHAADYARIARSVSADVAQSFKVRRTGTSVPTIPEDMSARELYSAGYSAFNARDYETAILIWTRAASLDPKMTTALNGLGWAYQRLGRYEQAIDALERQRKLEPTNKKIDADLGYVYEQAGRLEDAAAAYERHLSSEPLDGPKHRALGEILADLDRHEEALASFRKALPLIKDDPWLHRELGRSLLALGKRAEARAAFDAALKADRSPAIRAAIAWNLADSGVELDLALQLSASATDGVLASMRDIRAESLASEHFDLMERLAWAWEARGMVQLRRGAIDQAITSLEAAWQLGGTSQMAFHLAQAYEKKERRADAASQYLMARALDSTPTAELEGALKRFYPDVDVTSLLDAAGKQIVIQRSIKLEGKSDSPKQAQFNALLDPKGRVIEVSFLDGEKTFVDFIPTLTAAQFPLTALGPANLRIAARIRIGCEPTGCYANVQLPRHVQ